MNTISVDSTSYQESNAPIKDVKKSIWTNPKKAMTAISTMVKLISEAVSEGLEAEAAFRHGSRR